MRTYGVPEEILTDNGKVFTGRFNRPAVEVLFDRVCRENGIKHRLTEPRSPDHDGEGGAVPPGSMRAEFRTDRVFKNLGCARPSWTNGSSHYNTERPHQGIGMETPAQRFGQTDPATS